MTRPLAPAILAALLAAAPAAAADSRYSSNWGTPQSTAAAPARTGADKTAQKLVDELNKLIDQAEKARAADPVFLRDLRDLARRYDWPWSVRAVFDDWSDGNVTASPHWRVSGAAVSVDPRYGLRTTVSHVARLEPTAPSGGTQQPQQKEQKPGDVALQLFGQLLSQQNRDSGQAGSSQQQQPAAQPAPAPAPDNTVLTTTAAISNAFALELDLAVNARPAAGSEDRIELGVGQGAAAYGYRLVAWPAAGTGAGTGTTKGTVLEVQRIGSRGATVADRSTSTIDLGDGATHRLQLTRDRAGGMRVLLDGAVVSSFSDRAFNDAFDRLVIVNRGGDWTLRSVAAYGVN